VLLRNELGGPVTVALRSHLPCNAARFAGLQIACEPCVLELEADQERLVRVAVDLSSCAATATGEVDVVIDALAGGEVVQKIWLTVVVCAGDPTSEAQRAG
jgi:hypothetical protein